MKGRARLLTPFAAAAFALLSALPASAVPNWLPQNINPGYGEKVDDLYWFIYVIVAVFFFLTEGALLFCVFAFRRREGHKAKYVHGNNIAEAVWTVIPALILITIGVVQAGTWKEIRQTFPPEDDAKTLVVQAFPKQYAWEFRYAGVDGAFGTGDDVYSSSLHVRPDKRTVVKLSSSDVIHSLFIPNARVKLDAMPGILGRLWFDVDTYALWDVKASKVVLVKQDQIAAFKIAFSNTSGLPSRYKSWLYDFPVIEENGVKNKEGRRHNVYTAAAPSGKSTVTVYHQGKLQEVAASEVTHVFHKFDIACAELCGTNHFNMKSALVVDPPEVFEEWMRLKQEEVAKTGTSSDITIRWKRYWDEAHPNWNKVIK